MGLASNLGQTCCAEGSIELLSSLGRLQELREQLQLKGGRILKYEKRQSITARQSHG